MAGALRLRIPGYAEKVCIRVNGEAVCPQISKGYTTIPLSGCAMEISLFFHMPPKLQYADPRVAANGGKCAVTKGPLVYCLEEADNGAYLAGLWLDPDGPLREQFEQNLLGGTIVITANGGRLQHTGGLYSSQKPTFSPVRLRFVPYCFWANRAPGEMRIWLPYLRG